MSRHIPDVPKDWTKPNPEVGKTYEIELITPMVGGGVETRVNSKHKLPYQSNTNRYRSSRIGDF